MTAEIKANELIEKFFHEIVSIKYKEAKACAVILCDEMIDYIKQQFVPNSESVSYRWDKNYVFWQEVKTILLTPDKTQ